MILYAFITLCIIGIAFATVAFLRKYISETLDKKIFDFQNDVITKHCAEVENIYTQMRGWRHDYHNHIQVIIAHLALGQYDQANSYMLMLNDDLTSVDTIVQTGNVMVDAILNSKISLARGNAIDVNAKALVPADMQISEIDICVVVGNLLDNAMEACLKLEESQRRIRVYVGTLKEYLYISVTNTMLGSLERNVKLSSTKGGNHGFGLMRIDKIAEKYDGYVNRQHEDGTFATEVMLKTKK